MSVRRCTIDGATIQYTDTGTGPVVLFVHGVYVTGALWNDVVAQLGTQYRCISPTWLLGAHQPVGEPDVGAAAAARRIVRLLDELDLRDVTVVANDTGGGLTLAALGDPELDVSRIGRLILTNCDSYEHFPPGAFRYLVRLCRLNALLGAAALRGLASGPGQSFFLKTVCNSEVSPARQAQIFGQFVTNSVARGEGVRVTASLDPALTMRAGAAIEAFDKPVTLVWGTDDKLFPLDHAKRLADAFPNSRLIEVKGSSTFVMLDAPEQVASAIVDAVESD